MLKLLTFLFLLAELMMSGLACADDGPKVIAVGEWSKPVADRYGYTLRGRLVLCESAVAEDRRETAVFVELQEASDFVGASLRVFCDFSKHDFRPEFKGGLQCQLRDKDGNEVTGEGFPFSGAVPKSQWVTLPTDGTIRLRTTPFGVSRPGAIVVCPDLGKLWVIEDDDPNHYALSGTFASDPAKDGLEDSEGHIWRGTIELPPMKIVSRSVAAKRS